MQALKILTISRVGGSKFSQFDIELRMNTQLGEHQKRRWMSLRFHHRFDSVIFQ
jgi:hypothetical protein